VVCVPSMATPGAIIDVDGVLVRGSDALPGAAASLVRLAREDVPFVLLTNSGMRPAEKLAHVAEKLLTHAEGGAEGLGDDHGAQLKAEDAELLRRVLGDPRRCVTAIAPMADCDAVRDPAARLLLVTNPPSRREAELMALSFGVAQEDLRRRVVTLGDLAAMYPQCWPSRSLWRDEGGRSGEGRGDDVPFLSLEEDPVRAVLVTQHPPDWGEAIQAICDVVRGGGAIAERPANRSQTRPAVPVLGGNPDLDYADAHHLPRLTLGAFLHCVESLYPLATREDSAAPELTVEHNGKPYAGVYRLALARLREQLNGGDNGNGEQRELGRVFCIGDNPAADIRGARTLQRECGAADTAVDVHAVLTCAGMFRATRDQPNSAADPADSVVASIVEAAELVLGGNPEGAGVRKEAVKDAAASSIQGMFRGFRARKEAREEQREVARVRTKSANKQG
jgi:ribonucleotide monophosphatase NagD (HAD superfamily)